MSVKNCFLLILIFFLQGHLSAQNGYSLKDFHDFASSEDFYLKKVVTTNPDSINLDTFSIKFSGDLHSLRFARNVITISATFKNSPSVIQTEFGINTLNARSFDEISIIRAIDLLYDKATFYSYLEFRALKAFAGSWEVDANLMGLI